MNLPGIRDGSRHLVVSAPTSAGKTRVAEQLVVHRLRENPGRKALVALPYIEMCVESAGRLSALLRDVGDSRKVRHAYGVCRSSGLLAATTGIIVATFESALTILPSDLCCVVIDEVHMLGDPDRGHAVELLLAKLKDVPSLQLVCLSATLPCPAKLAAWLGAAVYECTERPIPLQHHVVRHDGKVLQARDGHLEEVRQISPHLPVVTLTRETVEAGGSVLIFCSTKMESETVAKFLRTRLVGFAGGIAHHHADLSSQEKADVVRAFRTGSVRVLCCTPTLAAGVNLPVRRVLMLHPWIGIPKNVLTTIRYAQMAGRAGRAGFDACGECYLMPCQKVRETVAMDLVLHVSQNVFAPDLLRSHVDLPLALLDGVVTGSVHDDVTGMEFAKGLWGSVSPDKARGALEMLITQRMVVRDAASMDLLPTPLGRALVSSGQKHSVADALSVREDLLVLRRHCVLDSDIQPSYVCVTEAMAGDLLLGCPAWHQVLYAQFLNMDELDGLAVSVLGIDQGYIMRIRSGLVPKAAQGRGARLCAVLVLCALLKCVPVARVAAEFGVSVAKVEKLNEAASRRAWFVRDVCRSAVGLETTAAVFENVHERMALGATADIVPLVRLPAISKGMAKKLVAVGLSSLEEVLYASDTVLLRALGWREDTDGAKLGMLRADVRVHLLETAAPLTVHDVSRVPLDDPESVVSVALLHERPGMKRPVSPMLDVVWSTGARHIHVDHFLSASVKCRIVTPNAKALFKVTGTVVDIYRDVGLAMAHAGNIRNVPLTAAHALHTLLPPASPSEVLDLEIATVLNSMETRGMSVVDLDGLRKLHMDSVQIMSAAEDTVAVYGLDVTSTRQLGEALGLASTSAKALRQVSHPPKFVENILEYRRAREVVNGINTLLAMRCEDGCVHPSFSLLASETGRITTESPNLQSVPKCLRQFLGPPGGGGYSIIAADYKHIELRIMAHFSGDNVLCCLLSDPDADVFHCVSQHLGISRDNAKRAVYGMCYGMGEDELALRLSRGDDDGGAHTLRDTFRARFPVLHSWLDSLRVGTVEALGGRRRVVSAKHVAVNTLCQASAAYILKLAMRAVDVVLPGSLLLCVHDELLLQVPDNLVSRATELLKKCMESCITLRVPLFVTTSVGKTWSS